jgi:hypothetical protein
MIRFALRLAVAGGKEAAARLVIIAAAVALGVGLLLATLAGINGVNAQNARYAWLNTGGAALSAGGSGGTTGSAAPDPLWWLLRGDYFDGQTIGRVDVAATGPRSPVPPGLPRLPGPGEFYASPALSALLRSTPADQLGDRYPGHQVGTIGPSALPSPNSLIIVIGHPPDELSREPGAVQVTGILTTPPSECDNGCYIGISAAGIDLILAVVAGALLFPLLMFIGTATRLAATRREQRFAAMRLIGATPRQVSVIAAVESTVSALAGTAVGFGLFFLFRRPLAEIPFTGALFFPEDLALRPVDILLVAVGIPAAAAIAARFALRRVHITPLGVSRRVTPRAPRAYRLIPLAAGIGELAYFVGRRPDTSAGQVRAFLPGFLVIMIGLVVAGPWLTMIGSRILARLTRRPATLIAARRLSDNPQAGFRAISGLVLAMFVTSAALAVISTIVANRWAPTGGAKANNLVDIFRAERAVGPEGPIPDRVRSELISIPGVQGVAAVHVPPDDTPRIQYPRPYALASCAELARTPAAGRCATGAEVAWVYPDLLGPAEPIPVWPTATITTERLGQLRLMSVVVVTDGSTPALERARTVLEAAYPQPYVPYTEAEFEADAARVINQWKQLANVVILSSLVIAGCSLAVSVAGGLNDRKRPFSMLRLTGVPLGVLRRVVALESAAPLLVAAVVAAGTGFLAAHLFLAAEMDYAVRPPGVAYYAIVLAGLAASLGIIAATLPLLRRITGPETARNE